VHNAKPVCQQDCNILFLTIRERAGLTRGEACVWPFCHTVSRGDRPIDTWSRPGRKVSHPTPSYAGDDKPNPARRRGTGARWGAWWQDRGQRYKAFQGILRRVCGSNVLVSFTCEGGTGPHKELSLSRYRLGLG
jgi:hypothetical protein